MLTYDGWDILVRTSAVAATAAGLALPGGWCQRVRPVARRPWAAAGVVALVSLVVNLTVALRHGIPQPRVHDEFAYLLMADTFAHGRLTNPTPACPDSFQSPHVLVRPTYQAKYPPGQGVALAVGQWLGQPIVGVWMTGALAAVAVWWMVAAFAPGEWALLGGVVAAVHPQGVDWGQVYWGGDVAALGGALVVGAWGRLARSDLNPEDLNHEDTKTRRQDEENSTGLPSPTFTPSRLRGSHSALWLGVGLIALANSRPYEGLILAVPVLAMLGWTNARRGWPALVILIVGGGIMAVYNSRVTGHALRMPFAEYARQFDVYPKFWFLPPHATPAYPNAVMAAVHTIKERGRFDLLHTWPGRWATAVEWARRLLIMHARPVLLVVPLAASLLVPRARRVWLIVLVFLLGLMAENWFLPHYAAPVTPAIVLLLVLGWERLSAWGGPMSPFVRRLGRGVAVGFAVAAALSAFAPADPDLQRFTRADLLAEQPALRQGRHLVFVRYTADHPVEDEWVYNGADLAQQPILWARSLDPAQDAAVIAAYGPRRTWVLTVGKSTHALAAVR
jgi:hypothetical protein